MSRLAVVILNWNGKGDTLSCIESIHRTQEGEFDIIVVDNGSTDGSAKSISSRYPKIRIVRSPKNQGFAGGMNIGIETCIDLGYSKLLLLNNDTQFFQEGVLEAYNSVLERYPSAGAVTASIALNREGSIFQRELVADASLLKTLLLKIFCPPYPLPLRRDESFANGIRCRSVPMIHGVAMGIRTSVLNEVGKFDPDFFCYEEDRDLLIRITKANYKLLTLPNHWIYHKWSGTTEQISDFKMYYKSRNLLYMKSRYSSLRYVVYAYVRLLGVALKNKLTACFLRGIKDGFRGKKGNSFKGHQEKHS